MAEWIEDAENIGEEFSEAQKRIQGESQEHVKETLDYLESDVEGE